MNEKLWKIFQGLILYPLSWIWDAVYRFRRISYRYGKFHQYKFKVPVISVGNLSFGGTGKTPFTLWIAEYFAKKNKKVMILMRGYKGKFENRSGILKGGARIGSTPIDYGDEAILLSRRLPNATVVVGKNRAENLLHYFDQVMPDVVILDDGHQHLRIARDLNFVLFDALAPMSDLKTAPLGKLREGPSALFDADAVILGRANQVPSKKLGELKKWIKPHIEDSIPVLEIEYYATALLHDYDTAPLSFNELKGRPVICVAAIASPESFFHLVESLEAKIIQKVSYPDHHFFSVEELRPLLKLAEETQAFILTTEKDIVKIRRITDHKSIYYVEIGIRFKGQEDQVWALFEKILEKSGP